MAFKGSLRVDDNSPYLEALAKLFPAEGVAVAPMIPVIAAGSGLITAFLTGAVVLLIIILRYFGTQPPGGGRPSWIDVAVAVVSFLIYAATIQVFGLILPPEDRHTVLMNFLTVFWIAAVPFISKAFK